MVELRFDQTKLQEMAKTLTEEPKLNNSNIIKNISYDQSEILWNIMQLYNNKEPFECDITASELKFYDKGKIGSYSVPVPKILFDVYPQRDNIGQITPFQPLPLDDNSIGSVVFDPPFVISPKTAPSVKDNKDGSNIIFKRFHSFYPVEELYYNYYWWINECYRVLKDDGIMVGKFQNTVSSSYQHNSEEWAFMTAMNAGFYVVDKFILEAKARLISSSKIKTQKHARKYTSVFYVFKKNTKMAEKYNYFKMLKEMDSKDLRGMEWEIK